MCLHLDRIRFLSGTFCEKLFFDSTRVSITNGELRLEVTADEIAINEITLMIYTGG